MERHDGMRSRLLEHSSQAFHQRLGTLQVGYIIHEAPRLIMLSTHSNTALTTEELAAYARPELFHTVETRIDADLLTPFVHGFRGLRRIDDGECVIALKKELRDYHLATVYAKILMLNKPLLMAKQH